MSRLASWNDKSVVITGASSGMGRLLALRVAAEGARVALVARREDLLGKVAKSIRELGSEAFIVPCDVSDPEQVASAAAAIQNAFGPVEVLVNNAGYGGHFSFLEWDQADIERMVQTNLMGTLYWTKALLPGMVEQGRGWVVFMASVAGRIGVPGESVYSATKFAMVGLAEALSVEVEDSGVHVLTVCPGAIDTEFFSQEDRAHMPQVALRSMIKPERVVDAVLDALARGKREITIPRAIATAYAVRALTPGLMRYGLKRAVRKRP